MSKRRSVYTCPNQGCTKHFKQDGMNEENYQRHLNTCLHRKNNVKTKGSITGYFNVTAVVTENYDDITETGSFSDQENISDGLKLLEKRRVERNTCFNVKWICAFMLALSDMNLVM